MKATATPDWGLVGLAEHAPEPCTLVILGGGGDLARRKLLPAIYDLLHEGLLPEPFSVIGCGRREYSDEDYRRFAREAVEAHARHPVGEVQWQSFASRLHFVHGSVEDNTLFSKLTRRFAEIRSEHELTDNRIFYFAVPPSLIETCASGLERAGLVHRVEAGRGFTRAIVEKPIGHDLESAQRINATLAEIFDERQTFRIDHYLGKETVQNIFVKRFANAIFEPLWNERHIDHVQITVAEDQGIGERGGYYEEAGALRDMVQNHMLQLLSLIAMEPPWAMNADVVRDHKLDVLSCLRPIERCDECVVRAQYSRGIVAGESVPGYREETHVSSDSATETFVAIKTFVDNWRWAGVPFYLRTGKRLPKRASEVAVQFKPVPPILFNADALRPLAPNVLALRIQPDEGFSLSVSAKRPGPEVRVEPVKMDFHYRTSFEEEAREPYERLLLDVAAGDATLFMRHDEVEVAWKWVSNILDYWDREDIGRLPHYAAGDWGPVEADRLIESDGRSWRRL